MVEVVFENVGQLGCSILVEVVGVVKVIVCEAWVCFQVKVFNIGVVAL